MPLDHPARFVAEFVDALGRDGWSELGVEIGGDPLGAPAYHPRALLSVWLYGFMAGVRSCQKLEAACRDQISYLWLAGWQHPDHNTLWRFYKGHRQAMRKLFERTVRTAVTMKLVDLAVQAVDGTKVVANASLNRSSDAEGLRGLLDRVERAIEDLEAQNEAGEDTAAADLPEELADKEVLREKVKQAMDDLANQERHKRINLTDRDARLMKGRQGIVAGYNAQAMVSPVETAGGGTGMLVTAVDVVDEANDNAMLAPMMERAEETTGTKSQTTLADAGYFAGSHLEECASLGQQVVVSEARRRYCCSVSGDGAPMGGNLRSPRTIDMAPNSHSKSSRFVSPMSASISLASSVPSQREGRRLLSGEPRPSSRRAVRSSRWVRR